MRPHPLKSWLTAHSVAPEEFADRIDCSLSHLRSILNGNKRAGSDTGFAIESATDGAVTYRALYEWHAARGQSALRESARC